MPKDEYIKCFIEMLKNIYDLKTLELIYNIVQKYYRK